VYPLLPDHFFHLHSFHVVSVNVTRTRLPPVPPLTIHIFTPTHYLPLLHAPP